MRFGLVCLLIFMSAGLAHAAGDPAKGEPLAATCLGCHGVSGYSNVYPTYHVPKLGGQHADYLAAALMAYKKGDRSHTTMQAQAADLTPAQIADIAAYFSQYGQ